MFSVEGEVVHLFDGCWFWACWLRLCSDSIKSAYWSLVKLRVWVGIWMATGAVSSDDDDEDWTSWREIESIKATGHAMLELCNLLRHQAWGTGGSWGKGSKWWASLKGAVRASLRQVFGMEGECGWEEDQRNNQGRVRWWGFSGSDGAVIKWWWWLWSKSLLPS